MYTQEEKDEIRKRCEENRDKYRAKQQEEKQEHSAMWRKLADASGGGASAGPSRSVQAPKAEDESKSPTTEDEQKKAEREANEKRIENLKFHEAQQKHAQQQRYEQGY